MALDSQAVFSGRIVELGLGDIKDKFDSLGWTSHANFAFATQYRPEADEAIFLRELYEPLTTEAKYKPAVRRLFYESFTLAANDLKRRVESTGDEPPRRVPPLEREERRTRLAQRLIGVDLEQEELSVSDRLIDRAIEIYEGDALIYLPPGECTKREMELKGIKKDPMWVADANGNIKLKVAGDDPTAAIDSQWALQFAWRRRSIAMEIGDIMSFEVHEMLTSELISAVMRTPLVGYARVSIEQALRADQLAFRLMAGRTRRGIKRDIHMKRPCDEAMVLTLKDPLFVQSLLSLPAGSAPSLKRSILEMSLDDAVAGGRERPKPPPPQGKSKAEKKAEKRKREELKKKEAAESKRNQGGAIPRLGSHQRMR